MSPTSRAVCKVKRAAGASLLLAFLATIVHAAPDNLVFATWNVRNYRSEASAPKDGSAPTPPKNPESLEAVAKTIAAIHPDVLNLCEIGTRRDLENLQKRLAELGVKLPHAVWVEASDQERHLALLSAYPVASEQHETRASFILGGAEQPVHRGFLDCTIRVTPDFSLRVLGAHLKSRRNSGESDPSEFRRHESLLLRRHVEDAAAVSPYILLCGDLNDTKDSTTVASLTGRAGSPAGMHIVPLADRDGETWTYHWSQADEYTRVDYVMVSRALRPLLQSEGSLIVRDRDWLEASDHRPLVVRFKIP